MELSLPESVIEIQANAFSWCSKLKKIKIGENVTLIGENAFWNCSGIIVLLTLVFADGTPISYLVGDESQRSSHSLNII